MLPVEHGFGQWVFAIATANKKVRAVIEGYYVALCIGSKLLSLARPYVLSLSVLCSFQ